ncbi:MAG: hypothetical protein AAF561_07615 [Planctomycetota bacterium]
MAEIFVFYDVINHSLLCVSQFEVVSVCLIEKCQNRLPVSDQIKRLI